MLKIWFGKMPDAIYNPSIYFKNTYLDSWLEDEFVQKMAKSIDKATVLSGGVVDSKALGLIPPTQLSGGLKALILMYEKPDVIINATTCGDNCAFWVLKIAKNLEKTEGKDLTINLLHIMDFGKGLFTIQVLNTGKVVHNMPDLLREAIEVFSQEVNQASSLTDID